MITYRESSHYYAASVLLQYSGTTPPPIIVCSADKAGADLDLVAAGRLSRGLVLVGTMESPELRLEEKKRK